jgi:DNA-binding MarR family transcriptional regulator
MNAVLDPSPQAALKVLGCTHLRLRQLMRHVGQHYDLEMAKVGLKTTQYSLLSHVLKLGPIRPGALAQAMQFSASTLTRNLKPLIDAGWVELSAGSDARSRSVTITALGRAKRSEARQHWRAAQQSLNRLLGAQRVLALHALIDESIDLLSGVDSGDSHA